MLVEHFDAKDPDHGARFRAFFGPQMIDQHVRQAISACWMALPRDRRNVDEVEKQIRRLLDRALGDFRDDAANFGSKNP